MKTHHVDPSLLEFIISQAKERVLAREVILFGSRARGNPREHSDYDIAFDIPKDMPHDKWAEFCVLMQEQAPTLLSLDLVNLNAINDAFRAKILNEGTVIYKGNHGKSLFTPLDQDNWPRKHLFEHYTQNVVCSSSRTVDVEIGALLNACKEKSVKLYPAMIYIISTAVNSIDELKIDRNSDGSIGTWNVLFPCYTVFHDDNKTFSNIWTPYDPDFQVFHRSFKSDLEQYSDVKDFMAKPDCPQNTFPISCTPWVNFTSFNLNIFNDGSYLRPIFTYGKFTRHEQSVTLPLAAQLHHAVCDGYHAGLLIEKIRGMCLNPNDWM